MSPSHPADDQRAPRALQQLDLIENEMRRIGYWSSDPPDLQAAVASGQLSSFLDAPSFELWLQCVFIPNARKAAQEGKLPPRSQAGDMAMREYNFHSSIPEAHPLMKLLQQFDAIIENRDQPQP